MKFKLSVLLVCLSTFSFAQSGNSTLSKDGWKSQGTEGLEYKIISKGTGTKLDFGNYIEIHMKEVYRGARDTVLQDTRESMPGFIQFESLTFPEDTKNILLQVREGDSLIIRQPVKNIFKAGGQPMPPFMTSDGYLYSYTRILNIFLTQKESEAAQKIESALAKPKIYKKQLEEAKKKVSQHKDEIERDDKIILEYLTKNNIKATKTEWGTYISFQNEGAGEKINNSSIVSINYTGKNFDNGEICDSSTDPKFVHVEPLKVMTGQLDRFILGWMDAMPKLRKGAKATIYIPSSLAYGTEGRRQGIQPNAIFIYDMEIIDVVSETE